MTGCLECGKPISAGATRCKAHANALRNRSPEMRAKSAATMTVTTRLHRAKNDASRSESMKRRVADDPDYRQALIERVKRGTGVRTRESYVATGRAVAAAHATRKAARFSWCPAERLAELMRLRRDFGVDEGERIMREDLAEQERRRVAALTPFERMQEHVAKGGRLVPAFNPRKAEHDFSLVGGSLA